jgi:oligoendopeptidase F
VLLNYNGTLRDVFTIAHEMGHSLHSWYSHREQPQVYADYTILLAEVASTTNESLLLEHLLRRSTTEAEKKWLFTYYFDMVRTTFFRQAMFSEFERQTHRRAEENEALTPQWLSDLWGELCGKYHGPAMSVDDPIRMEWARIPHFYSAFYVYKYVTGFTAAGAFASAILNEGVPARERYLAFLKSGGNGFSLDILKRAGVDLKSPEPFERTMSTFREKLDEAKGFF